LKNTYIKVDFNQIKKLPKTITEINFPNIEFMENPLESIPYGYLNWLTWKLYSMEYILKYMNNFYDKITKENIPEDEKPEFMNYYALDTIFNMPPQKLEKIGKNIQPDDPEFALESRELANELPFYKLPQLPISKVKSFLQPKKETGGKKKTTKKSKTRKNKRKTMRKKL
jgi:hypothetical protein